MNPPDSFQELRELEYYMDENMPHENIRFGISPMKDAYFELESKMNPHVNEHRPMN